MFLKREKELSKLKTFLSSENSTAAMIYGVRQIGKSALILKSIEGMKNILYYECLDSTTEENIKQISRRIRTQQRNTVHVKLKQSHRNSLSLQKISRIKDYYIQ